MPKSKVVNISEYRGRVLGSGVGGSSAVITLDTHGPLLSVENSISYHNNTVTFYFDMDFGDVTDIKIWGDFDVSPSGLNHDLCGLTEGTAPWISPRETISFTVGNTSSVRHLFYIKARDDVWNETQVMSEGQYEPTVLIDASDFAKSKDNYFTVLFYADYGKYFAEAYSVAALGLSAEYKDKITETEIFIKDAFSSFEAGDVIAQGSDSVLYDTGIYLGTVNVEKPDYTDALRETILFSRDKIGYKEQYQNVLLDSDTGRFDYILRHDLRQFEPVGLNDFVSDGPEHRPNVFFGKEIATFGEMSSMDFPVSYHLGYSDSMFVTMPRMDVYGNVTDTASADADVLLRDEISSAEEIQFSHSDVTESNLVQDAGLVNSALYEEGGPYGVFFYFAVEIKDSIYADEYADFLSYSSDKVNYREEPDLRLIKKVELLSYEKSNQLGKLLHKENPDLSINTIFDIASDESGQLKSGMLNHIFYDDVLTETISTDFVMKLLQKENQEAYGKTYLGMQSDDYFISDVAVLPDIIGNEYAKEFTRPWVNADLNLSDSASYREDMLYSLPIDYFSGAYDTGLVTVQFNDYGNIPDPKWMFEVNSFDSGEIGISFITSISVNYYGGSREDSLLGMSLFDFGSVPQSHWEFVIDATDEAIVKESITTSLGGYDYAVHSSSMYNHLAYSDVLMSDVDYVILEKILLKENFKGEGVTALDFFSDDVFYYGASIISNLVEEDYAEEGTKAWVNADQLLVDSASSKESLFTGLFISETFISDESGIEDILCNDTFDYYYFVIQEIMLSVKVSGIEMLDLGMFGSETVSQAESSLLDIYGKDIGSKKDVLIQFEKIYRDKFISREAYQNLFGYKDEFNSYDFGLFGTYVSDVSNGLDNLSNFERTHQDRSYGYGSSLVSSEFTEYADIAGQGVLSVLSSESAFLGEDYFIDVDLIEKDEGFGIGSYGINLYGQDLFAAYEDPVITVWTEVTYPAKFVVYIQKENPDIIYKYVFDFGYGRELHSTLEVSGMDVNSTGYDSSYIDLFTEESGEYKDILSLFSRMSSDSAVISYSDVISLQSSDSSVLKMSPVLSQFKDVSVTHRDLIREFYKVFVDYAKAYFKKAVIGHSMGDTAGVVEDPVLSTLGRDTGVPVDTLIEFYKEIFEWGKGSDREQLLHFSSDAFYGIDASALNMFGSDITVGTDVLIEFYKELFERGKGKDKGLTSYEGSDYITSDGISVIGTPGSDYAYGRDTLIEFYKEIFDSGIGRDKGFTSYAGADLGTDESSAVIGTAGNDYAFGRDLLIEFYKDFIDYAYGKDSGLLNMPWIQFGISYDSAELGVPGKDYGKGLDVLSKFYKEIFDGGIGKDSGFLRQLSYDIGIGFDAVYTGMAASEFGVADAKYKFTILFKEKDFGKSSLMEHISLAGQEFVYPKEAALFLPCIFDVSEYAEQTALKEYLVSREKADVFADVVITVESKDAFTAGDFALIHLAEADIGFAEFKCTIVEEEDVRRFTVFDFGFSKVSKAALWMPLSDALMSTGEYAGINTMFKDTAASHEIYSKEFDTFDHTEHCFNTVVYDPTITQRDLIYFWEPGYDTTGEKVFNPLWGEDIAPGDFDYPYYASDKEYGRVIPYAVMDENAEPTYEFDIKENFIHADCSIYHHEFNLSLLGKQSEIIADVFAFEYDGLDLDLFNVLDYRYNYRLNLFESDTEVGLYRKIATADISELVDFIVESDIRYVSPSGVRKIQHIGIYAKGTRVKKVVVHSLSRVFNQKIYIGEKFYKVQMEVYFTLHSMYEYGPPMYVSLDFLSHCKEWLAEPNPEYPKYRSEFIYETDGWFRPLDIMPDLMTYKLYLNMGCGLSSIFSHPPKDRMDKFVMLMQQRHLYMDVIAPFSGYDAVYGEDGIIIPATAERSKCTDIVTEKSLVLEDYSYTCFNTVIYDTEITQRDLMFWWEPGYEKDSTTLVYMNKRVNPSWGEPIVPGDIDYPYYKGNENYGDEIPLYTSTLNSYASLDMHKEWTGEGRSLKVVSEKVHPLFTAYDSKFKISTYSLEVTEISEAYTEYIPWGTSIEIYVEGYHKKDKTPSAKYEYLGKKTVVSSAVVKTQEWLTEHERKTVYGLSPEDVSVDCHTLFRGYDLTDDYFIVSVSVAFSWYTLWEAGVQYEMDGLYMYYGGYQVINPYYKELRRQYVYDDDQWFKADDVLYYEPVTFKLYMNLECGAVPFMDRIPESKLDKFVLDKMTKHSKLDIIAPFVGDHSDIVEDSVINAAVFDLGKYREWKDISYTLFFKDYGYECEDIVVYSADGVQDRDIMYWWEKGYPVVKDASVVVPNSLLGKPIYVKDFDYPYTDGMPNYGEIIQPGKHASEPDFAPYSYNLARIGSNTSRIYFPIKKLTDGVETIIRGHVRADVGRFRLSLVVLWSTSVTVGVDTSPIYDDANIFKCVILKDICTADAVRIEETAVAIKYKSVDKIFKDFHETVRVQDVLNKAVVSRNSLYLGLLITAVPDNVIMYGSRVNQFKASVDFSIGLEEYAEEYLKYRSPGMSLTDGGFVTKDFYNDFMGLKFYVNLGCGEDLDAFPIEPKNEFERWIFTTARLGDRNIDYLFDGDLGQHTAVPIESFDISLDIHAIFRVYFNNYEFTVKDFGGIVYDSKYTIIGSDYIVSEEKYPVISIPETVSAGLSATLTFNNTMIMHEYGTISITPQFDALLAVSINSFMENPVVSMYEDINGDIDFAVTFDCKFTLFERALSGGYGLMAVPIDGSFLYDDDITLTVPAAMNIDYGEHINIVEFIFVYENGDMKGDPYLDRPVNNRFITIEDPLVNVAAICDIDAVERVRPDRNEIYREIGYVCFWVQIAKYPYVIDWLAGHFVDYFNEALEAEYVRLISCFGSPPGGWPPIQQYPSPGKIIPTPSPYPNLVPKGEPEEYRHREPHVDGRERKHGYIVFTGPGGHISYIPDPVDPPQPWEWAGGTSILLTKTIMNNKMDEYLSVVDAFYFALFDEDDNRVSEVRCMTLKDSVMPDGSVCPGSCFGAMVFFNLEPSKVYIVKETDKDGNIITIDLTSEFSGNKYLLPQAGLKVETEYNKCVDAGDMSNLVESFGSGKDHKPLPVKDDPYDPWVIPDPDIPSGPYGPRAPFIVNPHKDGNHFPPEPIRPYVDGPDYPPIVPYPFGPFYPPEDPIPVPGYIGKLLHGYEENYYYEDSRIYVPVDMWASIWSYHYIPATFILELSGMRMELLDGFDFEIEEPFRFDFDGFGLETEEPFEFDLTGFSIEVIPGFQFGEDPLLIENVQEFYLEDVVFEFELQFKDFNFGLIEYDGSQITPAPEVIAEVITYDGELHPLCYPRGVHGTILYQVDGEKAWSADIPERSEAGSYIVNWYAMESLEYSGYGSEKDYHMTYCNIRRAEPVIDISRIDVPFNVSKDIIFNYTGDGEITCQSYDVTVCTCEIVSKDKILSTKNTYRIAMRVTGKSCGECDILISCTAGDNYLNLDKKVVCYVLEAELKVKAYPVVVQYTGKPSESNIVVDGTDDYTIYYSDSPIINSSIAPYKTLDFCVDVGDYTVYYVVKAVNYKPSYGKFRLTVNKIAQEIQFKTYSGVFDYKAHALIESVTGCHGSIWYSVDMGSWSSNIPIGAMPGKYVIYWYCVGDENYYDDGTESRPNSIMAVIEKMPINNQMEDIVMNVNDTVYADVPTPSSGALRISCSDYSVLQVGITGKKAVIKAISDGGAFVYVKQLEDFFYMEHTFSFHVEVR